MHNVKLVKYMGLVSFEHWMQIFVLSEKLIFMREWAALLHKRERESRSVLEWTCSVCVCLQSAVARSCVHLTLVTVNMTCVCVRSGIMPANRLECICMRLHGDVLYILIKYSLGYNRSVQIIILLFYLALNKILKIYLSRHDPAV